MRRLSAVAALLIILLIAACGQSLNPSLGQSVVESVALANSTPAPTSLGSVTDTASFAAALHAAGADVTRGGNVTLNFLHTTGTILHVDDDQVQVYEYATANAARADAARFSPDGIWVNSDIGTTRINWLATPHLYADSRLIAVYIGDQTTLLTQLARVLGAPFAGGANPYHAQN